MVGAPRLGLVTGLVLVFVSQVVEDHGRQSVVFYEHTPITVTSVAGGWMRRRLPIA